MRIIEVKNNEIIRQIDLAECNDISINRVTKVDNEECEFID